MLTLLPSLALALQPPVPVVLGASPLSQYVFAKLQRAAQLPGAGFKGPKAFGSNEAALQKVLWSQFGMANAQSYDLAERARFDQLRNIEGAQVMGGGLDALVFCDTLPAQQPFNPFPFGKKAGPPSPPPLDTEALKQACSKGMLHAYVALGDCSELAACVA